MDFSKLSSGCLEMRMVSHVMGEILINKKKHLGHA